MSDPTSQRLPGPDVARALAIVGVIVMNYHGYLIIRGAPRDGGWVYDLFDPWEGPLSTRFAATFVLVAGVGVTLLTRSAAGDPKLRREASWRLARRGLLLYGVGIVFDFVWPGTILVFYGAMFVLAALLWRLGNLALATIGVAAAVAGWLIEEWIVTWPLDTSWLTDPGPRSPRGLLIDVFVNGTHPLLPWLLFFCCGIVLGRYIGNPPVLRAAAVGGAAAWIIARLAVAIGDGSHRWSIDPFDRGIVYSLSALGSAVVAFVIINELANRYAASMLVDALQRGGQMTLTIYLAHALVFNAAVDWYGWIAPDGISTAITAALTVWIVSLVGAIAWQRRFGRGPAEWLYRRLTV